MIIKSCKIRKFKQRLGVLFVSKHFGHSLCTSQIYREDFEDEVVEAGAEVLEAEVEGGAIVS